MATVTGAQVRKHGVAEVAHGPGIEKETQRTRHRIPCHGEHERYFGQETEPRHRQREKSVHVKQQSEEDSEYEQTPHLQLRRG